MKTRLAGVTLVICLLLSACSGTANSTAAPSAETVSSISEVASEPVEAGVDRIEESIPTEDAIPVFEGPSTEEYIRQVVQENVAKIEQPEMSEYEKVKAVFDYIIEISDYQRPAALDIWRIRSTADTVPSYEETRALFILLYGFGTCEDYTAAFNLMLNEMGIETRYMTGQTYSRNGGLVMHSWSQVKVDGVWYNLDVELEDGISNGTVVYRYFLKSDATMSASHFWGQRLIDTGALTEGQNEVVRLEYMGENCPQDYPTPSPSQIAVTSRPDRDAIRAELLMELRAYEETYGELAYMELDVFPPVFVRYWHESGEEPEGGMNDFIRYYERERMLIPPSLEDDAQEGAASDW